MRKLIVFLVIIILLAIACTPNPDTDPGPIDDPGQQPLDPADPEPDPGGDDEDDDVTGLAQAEIIWETDTPPSHFKHIQADNILLYPAYDVITAQSLGTGAVLWRRDLASEGLELSDILLYETPPFLVDSTLTYPVVDSNSICIEQLNIETGDVIWQQEIGSQGEVSFQVEDKLLKVVANSHITEQYIYYSLRTGQHIPALDGSTAYWHQGAYYTFSQEAPYVVAKYDVDTGQRVWETTVSTIMSYPYLSKIWSNGNVVLFDLADFNGLEVDYLTLAVNNEDGTELWSKKGSRADYPGDNVILIADGKTTLVDIISGEDVQEIAVVNEDFNSFIWKGALYCTGSTVLSKIDLSNGETLWEQAMSGRIDMYYGVDPEDNLRDMGILWALLERTEDPEEYLEEELIAIDPQTGRTISSFPFTVPFGGPESWPIKLTQDQQGKTYIVMERGAHLQLPDRSVAVIDAETGQELWSYNYPSNYSEVNVFFSDSNHLVVVLRNFSQEIEVLYLTKETGTETYHFQAEGYPSLMIGDRILMGTSPDKTTLISPIQVSD